MYSKQKQIKIHKCFTLLFNVQRCFSDIFSCFGQNVSPNCAANSINTINFHEINKLTSLNTSNMQVKQKKR